MTSGAQLLAARRGRIAGAQRTRTPVMIDTFQRGSTSISLENHVPDPGSDINADGDGAWGHNTGVANSSTLALGGTSPTLHQNQIYNYSTGTANALYYSTVDPGTTDYRVTVIMKQMSSAENGNNMFAVCRASQTVDTFYGASIGLYPTGGAGATPVWQVVLTKHLSGSASTLKQFNIPASSTTTNNEIFTLTLDCSNDEKVVYIQGPVAGYTDHPVRVISVGDNSINAPGNAGVYAIRCAPGLGQHFTSWLLELNGPQDQAGTTPAPVPDPVQTPQLLWEPDYSTATLTLNTGVPQSSSGGLVPGQIWRNEQEPYVRGALQTTRMQIVTGSDIPGSGTYKPTDGAMRVELRTLYNSSTDLTMYLTAPALATDTTLTMSSSDAASLSYVNKGDFIVNHASGEVMRVAGVPSGTSVPILRGQSTTPVAIATTDRLTVATGDVSDSGGTYQASRAEVYDRFPAGGSSTPPVSWPDPVGSIRWYGISYYIPVGFPITGDTGTNPWITVAQWKGQYGGSPPRSIGIDVKAGTYGQWILDGASGRPRQKLKMIVPGTWTRFVFGIRWDTSSLNGWITAYQDGSLIVPKRAEATMDMHSGGADPIYFKNGIYRVKTWAVTQTIHIGPPKVGTTMNDVVAS